MFLAMLAQSQWNLTNMCSDTRGWFKFFDRSHFRSQSAVVAFVKSDEYDKTSDFLNRIVLICFQWTRIALSFFFHFSTLGWRICPRGRHEFQHLMPRLLMTWWFKDSKHQPPFFPKQKPKCYHQTKNGYGLSLEIWHFSFAQIAMTTKRHAVMKFQVT